MYILISSSNEDTYTASFLVLIPLIFFSCIISRANILSTILKSYGESTEPSFVPDFNGIVLSFPQFMLTMAMDWL